MIDARLNSVHLDYPRREDFRAAREQLLNGRGELTRAAESRPDAADHHTHVQDGTPGNIPTGLNFWLMDKDRIYPLKVGVNTIGRLPDNDVVVEGACVSRRHCAILVHVKDGGELFDIASKNGTYINGRKIAGPTRLQSGDVIRLCDLQFIFVTRDGAPASPAERHDTLQAPNAPGSAEQTGRGQ